MIGKSLTYKQQKLKQRCESKLKLIYSLLTSKLEISKLKITLQTNILS